jgi:hypothetical protein
MAIALPSPADLQAYREGSDVSAIQLAADLFVMATGLVETTTDLEARIVRAAILDMAWAITARHEDREEEFSRFTGERLGSYSYNKAASYVKDGVSTGVTNFDLAVEYFKSLAAESVLFNTDTEWVFAKGYQGSSPLIASHDPGNAFLPDSSLPWPSPPSYIIGTDDDGFDIVIENGDIFIEED